MLVRFENFQSPMGVCRELFRFVFGDRDLHNQRHTHNGQQAAVDSDSVIEKVNTGQFVTTICVSVLPTVVSLLALALAAVRPVLRGCGAGRWADHCLNCLLPAWRQHQRQTAREPTRPH